MIDNRVLEIYVRLRLVLELRVAAPYVLELHIDILYDHVFLVGFGGDSCLGEYHFEFFEESY